MVFPLGIRPVSVQCLRSSDKVFSVGVLKGRQSYASCFVLLVERPMRRLGKRFGSATPQVGGCQPRADPVTASFLQPGDATAFVLLAITQRSSRSQTLPRGWGPKSECNKCALGAAAPHWRPFLSCPPRHDRGRDRASRPARLSRGFCFVAAFRGQIVCFAVFLMPSALLSLPSR